jgi:hypothetical protein
LFLCDSDRYLIKPLFSNTKTEKPRSAVFEEGRKCFRGWGGGVGGRRRKLQQEFIGEKRKESLGWLELIISLYYGYKFVDVKEYKQS